MFAKIFGACALGAAVGTALALELAPYLWWVGMLVGGLVGYFTYEFREVLRAAQTAWKKTIAWRPFLPWWRVVGRTFAGSLILTTLLVVAGTLGVIAFKGNLDVYPTAFAAAVLFSTVWSVATSLNEDTRLELKLCRHTEEHINSLLEQNRYQWLIAMVATAFFSLILFLSYWDLVVTTMQWLSIGTVMLCGVVFAAYGAVWLIRRVIPVLGRFFWAFFKLIHSDIRLLCAVDAALGTAAGYAAGSALVGALAGGTLGVVNYYLVSVCWLKLAPASMNEKP